jgi:hypothetical protein
MIPTMKTMLFQVHGGFDIEQKFTEEYDTNGNIVALKLPNGKTIRLCVAFEIEDENGDFKITVDENDIRQLEVCGLDYEKTEFYHG